MELLSHGTKQCEIKSHPKGHDSTQNDYKGSYWEINPERRQVGANWKRFMFFISLVVSSPVRDYTEMYRSTSTSSSSVSSGISLFQAIA